MPAVKKIVPHGVSAVFDGVGKDTFVKSFDCTAQFGMLVNYGNASGHVPPIDILQLSLKGSSVGVRPASASLATSGTLSRARGRIIRARRQRRSENIVDPHVALADAAQAHRIAEAATDAGPIVLLP